MARASSAQVLSVLRAVLPEIVAAVDDGSAHIRQVQITVTCPQCRRDSLVLNLAATRAACTACGFTMDPIGLPLFRPRSQLSALRRREIEEANETFWDRLMRSNRPVDVGRAVVGER